MYYFTVRTVSRLPDYYEQVICEYLLHNLSPANKKLIKWNQICSFTVEYHTHVFTFQQVSILWCVLRSQVEIYELSDDFVVSDSLAQSASTKGSI